MCLQLPLLATDTWRVSSSLNTSKQGHKEHVGQYFLIFTSFKTKIRRTFGKDEDDEKHLRWPLNFSSSSIHLHDKTFGKDEDDEKHLRWPLNFSSSSIHLYDKTFGKDEDDEKHLSRPLNFSSSSIHLYDKPFGKDEDDEKHLSRKEN